MSSNSKLGRRNAFVGASQKRGAFPIRQNVQPQDKVVKRHGKAFTESVASQSSGRSTHNCQEELLQLVPNSSGTNAPFAMMIRLTPEILEQLKQASVSNISPQMKFGTNANGNVIQIGNQNFKFSSAPEPGDLCDIYEGQSGQNVLTEAGSVWNKLSVLRTLNDNEMFRVKKRTVEAEKKQNLRKSILVDSSTQIIVPQDTPEEANNKKNFSKQKKEPPLKRLKASSIPASKPTAPLCGTSVDNCHISSSPSQLPEIVHHSKNDTFYRGSFESSANNQALNEKGKVQTGYLNLVVQDGKTGQKISMSNLRNFLITILEENPKGVTLKKLIEKVEKTVEGLSFNLDKKLIEKVIKSIASYHAPGKYLLNPGVQKGTAVELTDFNSVKPSEEIHTVKANSSTTFNTSIIGEKDADINRKYSPLHQSCSENVAPQGLICESNDVHITPQESPKERVSGTKAGNSEDSEMSSSSESGSDSGSDSDSSDSGSGSTATNSGSGSDSDSSSSSSSSSTSLDEDMEVDIMSDDANVVQSGMKAPEMQPIIKEDTKNHPTSHTQTENIMETVFGSDDVDVVGDDHISPFHTSPIQSMLSKDIKPRSPLHSHATMTQEKMGLSHNKDQRKGNNFDFNIEVNDVDSRAQELDILVDRICYQDVTHANEMKKSPLALHDTDNAKKTLRSEPKAVTLKKKDAILEARDVKGEKRTERSQKLGRQVNENTVKQMCAKQSSISVSKKPKGMQKNGKHDVDGAKGKKQKVSAPGKNILEACEGVRVNHHVAKDDTILSKEGIAESKLPKPVDNKSINESKQQVVNKGGSENKGNPLRRTKGPVKIDRTAALRKDSLKVYSQESIGRAKPAEGRAEKPLKEVDTSKILKGTGRVPLNLTPFDEHIDVQNNPPKSDRITSHDLELGEFREPDPENDHGRAFGSSDVQIRSNQTSDTTSKASSRKWSVSPEAERPQYLYDIADQSSPNLTDDRNHVRRIFRQPKIDKGLKIKKKTVSGNSDSNVPGIVLHKFDNGEKIASSKSIDDTKGASVERVHLKERKFKVSKHLQSSYKHTSQSSGVQDWDIYSEYYKKNPEPRGPINSFEQLKDYYKEFNEKYPIYVQLNKCIESAREDFEIYQKHIEQAMSKGDKDKLGTLYMKVKKEYCLCHKKYKRMKHTFNVLHMELQVIKQHCQDYSQKFGKY